VGPKQYEHAEREREQDANDIFGEDYFVTEKEDVYCGEFSSIVGSH
jgi:hypothetical protein